MWELVRANKRRAAILVIVETLLLAILGFVFGEAVAPGGGLVGMAIGLAIAFGLFLAGYLAGDQALLAMSGAREVKAGHHAQLWNVVEEMKIASGLTHMPRVYIIDEEIPNAFACGRSPKHACVAVTSGLLRRLNRDELQGVIAHEIGHVVNRDILYMTLLTVMVGAVAILSHIFLRSMFWGGVRPRTGGGRRDGGGGAQVIFMVIAIVLAILAPVFARLVYLAVSRQREYLADASAAIYTRYPEGLASALEKISSRQGEMARSAPAMVPLYIIPPTKRALVGKTSLWSTHPSTDERIKILRGVGDSISYNTYMASFTKASHGKKKLAAPSDLSKSAPVELRLPSAAKKGPATQKEQLRQVTDLLWTVQGYRFLTCGCGLKFKVPAKYQKAVKCPRCGTGVTAPGGERKNPPSSGSAGHAH